MIPKLVAIAGPLKGAIFELTEDHISVGRDASNQLSLKDKSLSRRHCLISRIEDQFRLSDLESHNGTFVNEVPIVEHLLKHGDRIQLGSSYFLFLLQEDDDPEALSEIEFDDGSPATISLTRLRLEDAIYSMARDLNVLMKISSTINSIRSLPLLEKALMGAIFEVVPAERGVILLAVEKLDQPDSVFTLDRFKGPRQTFRLSRTVAAQVLSEGVAVLSNDLVEDDSLKQAESLIASRVRSLICVPLTLLDKPVGLIYLDTSKAQPGFNHGHLQLLTAIAGLASGALENVRQLERLEGENKLLREDIQLKHNMIGESQPMQDVYQLISKVAPTDSTVLIQGESGTGKELAAHAIHHNSPRARRPFVAVNCASLNETLLESELFGHERGAFTGAIAQKKGKFELADGGTVFLDEVGEMAPSVQARLLRVLQAREFERVGGTRQIKVDIRIIAATNKSLEEAVADGNFRRDLYYRLNVVRMSMPTLRARREDISLLANYFIATYSSKCKRQVTGLSAGARACLISYDWPGNVRELGNAIERAVVLGSTDYIQPEDLPEAIIESVPSESLAGNNYQAAVKEAKRQILLKTLEQANGNYTKAARLLGVHPSNLHRLMRNVDLKTSSKEVSD